MSQNKQEKRIYNIDVTHLSAEEQKKRIDEFIASLKSRLENVENPRYNVLPESDLSQDIFIPNRNISK
jgi:hypothetical protein